MKLLSWTFSENWNKRIIFWAFILVIFLKTYYITQTKHTGSILKYILTKSEAESGKSSFFVSPIHKGARHKNRLPRFILHVCGSCLESWYSWGLFCRRACLQGPSDRGRPPTVPAARPSPGALIRMTLTGISLALEVCTLRYVCSHNTLSYSSLGAWWTK